MKQILKIAFTGGPNAGKTEIIQMLKPIYEDKGKNVIVIGETSTEIISSGFKWWDNSIATNVYQNLIFKYQLEKENSIIEAVKNSNMDDIVILYDRGLLDGKAYMSEEDYLGMIKRYGYDVSDLYSRYDMVVYLESVALGMPGIFSNETNSARTSTAKQAIKFDENVRRAWENHSNFIVINCYPDFNDKYMDVLNSIKL